MGRRQDLDTALAQVTTQSGIPQVTTHSPASHKWQHSPASHKWQHTVRHPTGDNTQSDIPQVTTQSGIPQVTTQSGIPQVTTHSPASHRWQHSPASHKGQHTVRHYFPWHFHNTFINTVTFHNSRPFVKICWLSPRIAHLILQNLLYIFFLIPEFLNGLTAPVPSQLWRLVVTHGTQKQNSLSTPASPGVWQRKCMSPVQCQCQRLWPGNIV